MEQYIKKSALVAEIERRKRKLLDHIICERDKEWVVRTVHQLNRIIMFINTLEVEEVDIEKEISQVSKNEYFDFTDWKSIARHFYKLGRVNAKKNK